MRLVLAAGTTRTATIEGISAAGATPELMADTPAIDAEILVYGQPVSSDLVPVSPTGCPTPAVISRAVREQVGFDVTVIDAGLAAETDAPTVSVGAEPGRDIREERAVPNVDAVFDRARELGRSLPDDELFIGETIPGGTTTAAALLRALGTDLGVSSSLPENPIPLKEQVATAALDASGSAPGELVDSPLTAVEAVGDPVQATVAGLTVGALESGSSVTLAGGTQLVATAALVRAFGCDEPLSLATTSFVAADPAVDLDAAASTLDLDVAATDPGFERSEHVAMERYVAGEAKEGVGMGGALALAERDGIGMKTIRAQIAAVYDRLDPDSTPESAPAADRGDR
ncbi:nicotinate mononucleotide-dependent phosphoribosyltransferase CobT [Natranaeroarchaeum aerophilus]|uniref:UPF0284 protein AArcSt11_12575 n=1 Tax=Natranaeroarchaeum aerophilus TaxID=2917711 RepID=A0AAE3FSS9_9EURY|nr:TIGR00303 family protein [Natranaeroarchaeum aerophilus]MCL9814485.1 TIGR00303 family protein [Natranaeroarchaeum aerophilus]